MQMQGQYIHVEAFTQASYTRRAKLLHHQTACGCSGRWTVDMFAMFHLGRPDVFPLGDLAVRKGLQELYKLKVCVLPVS